MRRDHVTAGLASILMVTAWFGCSDDEGETDVNVGGAGGDGGGTTSSTTSPTNTNTSSTSSSTTSSTTTGGALDYIELTIDGNQEWMEDVDGSLCGGDDYTLQTIDISAYADGNSHTIEFYAETYALNGVTNFHVDLVSIEDCSGAGGGGGMAGAGGMGGAGGQGQGGGGTGCMQVVVDPSFELGTGWDDYSLNYGGVICNGEMCLGDPNSTLAQDGMWWAWFGGFQDGYEEGSVTQEVTIPATATELTFQFFAPVCDGV